MKGEFKANFEVLMRLADAFSENGAMKKTRLYFVSQLNWRLFQKYLSWLSSNKYIQYEIDGRDKIYRQTETGQKVFNMLITYKKHKTNNN